MTRKLGEVNYLDKSHQLICGNDNFPELEKVVELSLIEDDKADLMILQIIKNFCLMQLRLFWLLKR